MRISVVIPAFRPTYLRQAIASVLAQGREDFDLLVSDDSDGDAVGEIVAAFRDSRVRLIRTEGQVGGLENLRRIWEAAEGDAVKILHDDDVLLPNCLPDLCRLLEQNPTAPLIFGHRDVISADGRVIRSPRFLEDNTVAAFTRQRLAETMLPACNNRVGEFPNVLINKACGVTWDDFAIYQGFKLDMLVDVALYMNATMRGAAIGLGRTVAQYRQHGAQNSTPGFSPLYAKVVCEWELFVRGEYQAGLLSRQQTCSAISTLSRLYGMFASRIPELAILQEGLPTLKARVSAGDADVLDTNFLISWARIDEAIEERKAKAAAASSSA